MSRRSSEALYFLVKPKRSNDRRQLDLDNGRLNERCTIDLINVFLGHAFSIYQTTALSLEDKCGKDVILFPLPRFRKFLGIDLQVALQIKSSPIPALVFLTIQRANQPSWSDYVKKNRTGIVVNGMNNGRLIRSVEDSSVLSDLVVATAIYQISLFSNEPKFLTRIIQIIRTHDFNLAERVTQSFRFLADVEDIEDHPLRAHVLVSQMYQIWEQDDLSWLRAIERSGNIQHFFSILLGKSPILAKSLLNVWLGRHLS